MSLFIGSLHWLSIFLYPDSGQDFRTNFCYTPCPPFPPKGVKKRHKFSHHFRPFLDTRFWLFLDPTHTLTYQGWVKNGQKWNESWSSEPMWECCGRCWGLGCNLASAATTLPLPVHNHNPLTPLYLTPTHSLTPICAPPVAKLPTLARRAVDLCSAPPRPRALTEAGSGQPCVQVRPREGLCHRRPNMSHPASPSNCSDSPRKRQLLQISATCLSDRTNCNPGICYIIHIVPTRKSLFEYYAPKHGKEVYSR